MTSKKFYYVGHIFEQDNELYLVDNANNCDPDLDRCQCCDFEGTINCGKFSCDKKDRKSNEDAYFKKLDKDKYNKAIVTCTSTGSNKVIREVQWIPKSDPNVITIF